MPRIETTGSRSFLGGKISPLIGLHTAVAEVAVVGFPDVKWGERPYAFVVLQNSAQVEPANLQDHMRQFIDRDQISKWAMPEAFIIVSAIPKTSVEKIDKKRSAPNGVTTTLLVRPGEWAATEVLPLCRANVKCSNSGYFKDTKLMGNRCLF